MYSDTTPRLVLAGSAVTLTLDMQRPVYDYVVSAPGGSGVPNSGFTCVDLHGATVIYPDILVSYTARAAGRASVSLTNTLAVPVIVTNLTLRGRPLAVVEDGIESVGSGTPAREVGSGSVYIQNRVHAARLCKLYVDVYSVARPERVIECMYDPDRTLGEIVTLSCTSLGISGNHRITAIDVQNGALMSVTLIPITDLLTSTDVFLVGTSYTSETRQLSW